MSGQEIGTGLGAAVGFMFGNPALGAQIGGIAGGIVDGFLAPDQHGPRLEDRRIPASSYGAPIAIVYGTDKIDGVVMWVKADMIDEVATSESIGKGGPDYVSYTYFATFAVMFSEGPITQFRRIWADGNLIYDWSDNGLADAITNGDPLPIAGTGDGVNITQFLGTTDQLPSAHIEADRGEGAVSAHRGKAYLVFDALPLEGYGNRIPKIEAEIVRSPGTYYETEFRGQVAADWTNPQGHADPNDRLFYYSSNDASGSAAIKLFSTDDLSLLAESTITSYRGPANEGRPAIGEKYIYDTRQDGVHVLDKWTLQEITVLPSGSSDPTCARFRRWSALTPGYAIFGWGELAGASSIAMIKEASITSTRTTMESNFLSLGTSENVNVEIGPNLEVWVARDTTFLDVCAVTLTGDTASEPYELSVTSTVNLSAHTSTVFDVFYYEPGDFIVVLGSSAIIKCLPDGTYVEKIVAPANTWKKPSCLAAASQGPVNGKILLTVQSNMYWVDLATFTLGDPIPHSNWDLTGDDNIVRTLDRLDHIGAAVMNADDVIFFERFGKSTTTVETILDDLSDRSGLAPAQYDTSLVNQPIGGYTIRRKGPARSAAEDLMRLFTIDSAETDKVSFIPRGQASGKTLTVNDLGFSAGEPSGRTYREEVTRERQLPQAVNVYYTSDDSEYRAGIQTSDIPGDLIDTQFQLDVRSPVVISDDLAAQRADIIKRAAWTERRKFAVDVSYQHADLHEADAITLPIDSESVEARIERWSYANGIVSLETVFQDASVYVSDVTGAAMNFITQTVARFARTAYVPLDIPLLRDEDDGAGFYSGVHPRQGNLPWNGALVYKSEDGSGWNEWLTTQALLPSGTATGALGDVVDPWVWDHGNTLTVRWTAGTPPTTTTEAAVLNGANPLIISSGTDYEIVQAATVTDHGDGSYTFSDFLRGKRGTDHLTGGHAAGDRVYYPTTANLKRTGLAAERDLTRYYQPVTSGHTFEVYGSVTFANTDMGLHPYSPVQVAGSRDGSDNLTITWTRRGRVGGEWSDGADIPLGEESQAFEVDVYNGATVVRTITGLATETASYTAAQQTTDFGQAEAAIDIIVYQISATVGRGIGRSATV